MAEQTTVTVIKENIYWFYDKALNPKQCQDIIDFGNMCREDIAITSDQKGKTKDLTEEEEQKLKKIRDSRIAWIEPMRWMNIWFHNYMADANKNAGWNYDIEGSEQYQFTKYKEGHFYGWHQDSGPDVMGDNLQRKLSLVCSLTDPSEYEGGNLEIYSPLSPSLSNDKKIITEKQWFNQGTIIVFPSFLWHQVKKVTRGTRYSLVTWFRGKDFK